MLLQMGLSLHLLVLLSTLAAQSGATPAKDVNGRDIDLNLPPPPSPSQEHVSVSVEPVESSQSLYEPASVAINSPNTQLYSQEGSSQARKAGQAHQGRKKDGIWDRKFEYHRQVALALRHKLPSTLSRADREQLSKTRMYLAKVIRYHRVYDTKSEKLAICEDLLGNLRGGRWSKYTGPMDEEDLFKKSESKRVYESRKRLQQERESTSANPPAKRPKRIREIPDDVITPAQLITRQRNQQSKAKRRAKMDTAQKMDSLPVWIAKGKRA